MCAVCPVAAECLAYARTPDHSDVRRVGGQSAAGAARTVHRTQPRAEGDRGVTDEEPLSEADRVLLDASHRVRGETELREAAAHFSASFDYTREGGALDPETARALVMGGWTIYSREGRDWFASLTWCTRCECYVEPGVGRCPGCAQPIS